MSAGNYYRIITILFFALVLPIFINLIFNHPTFDDFYYSEKVRHFGFFEAQLKWYKYWTGKFFSTLVLSLNPLLFRSMVGYDLMLLVINMMTPVLIFKFLSEFVGDSLSTIQRVFVSSAVYFLFLFTMPSLSQGFYWLTGSVVYHLPILLIIVFSIQYRSVTVSNNTGRNKIFIACGFLTLIAITGCSEIAMVLIYTMFLSFLFLKLKAVGKLQYFDFIFLLALIIGSSAVMLAPGNELRSDSFPLRHDILHSVISTGSELIKISFNWIFLTPLIPVTVLVVPILYNSQKQSERLPAFMKLNPVYFVLSLLFVVSLCLFAAIWSTGLMPFKRTLNPVSIVFSASFIFISYVIYSKMNFDKARLNDTLMKFSYIPVFVILLYVGLMKNNVRSSFADLLTGTTSVYDRNMKLRYDKIKQSQLEIIEVTGITNIPRTFYFTDITEDKDFELNKWYAQYFKKKAIVLKK